MIEFLLGLIFGYACRSVDGTGIDLTPKRPMTKEESYSMVIIRIMVIGMFIIILPKMGGRL